MHRHLSRAAPRSLRDSYSTPRKSLAERLQVSQSFSTSQHDHYHFGWRDQAGTKYAQLQIVNTLRLGEREKASKMLLNLDSLNGSLSSKDFSFILDYCAQAPDPLFVMETWRIMEEKAVDVNKRCCRYITQAFTRGGYLKEAFNWLTYLGENVRVQGVLPMYNIFLRECGNAQSLINADSCLELMEAQHMGKSEITYWEILKLAVLQRSLSAVHGIWKDCTRYYSPSIITLRKFIWSFTRLGDLDSAYSLLQHMVALVNQGETCLMISNSRRFQSSRLDIPIPSIGGLPDWKLRSKDRECFLHRQGDSTETEGSEKSINANAEVDGVIQTVSHVPKTPNVSQILGRMFPTEVEKPFMKILRWSFNDVILSSALSRNCELAEQLFLQMLDLGLKPSKHTYDGFIKALIYGKGVAYGMKMIELMEKENKKPSNDTLAAVSIGHSKQLELDLAEDLLGRICGRLPKYIHPFNAFLEACDIMDKPERAVCILVKMKSLNIKPNIRTYELLFSLFSNVNVPYEKGNMLSHVDVEIRIKTIEMDMVRNGIQHSYISTKNLIRSLGAEGMIEKMLQYLNLAESMLWQTDPYQRSDMYDIVLHALVKAKEIDSAIDVFKNMRQFGLPASVATYNIMIECCSILKCFRSACALLSTMLRHGFFPQKLTYTALIKVLLANDEFEDAFNLLEQSSYEGIDPDIQLFNTILREALVKGRLDIIERTIEHIREKKIQPDPSTCSYTFSAYTESGFENTALEALHVLSLRMISEEDGTILPEWRAVIDDLIHDEGPDAESRIADIFNESQEYIAVAILNLRWCAIAGLSIKWMPGESPWSQRLVSCYGTREEA